MLLTKKHNKIKSKNGLFEQCQICENWVEVTKGCFEEDGESYYSPLMGTDSFDSTGRWVCSNCWDALDVKKYGPYQNGLPLYVFGDDVLSVRENEQT